MGMKSTIVLLEDAISLFHSYMHDMAGEVRLWFEMAQKLQHTGAKEQFLQIVMQGSMVWLFLLSVKCGRVRLHIWQTFIGHAGVTWSN